MPNLTAEDVRAMASPSSRAPQIIIAPSRDGGTNALMLQPPQAIPSPSVGTAPAPPAPGRGGGHPRPGCRVGLAALRCRPAGRLPAGLQLQWLAKSREKLLTSRHSSLPLAPHSISLTPGGDSRCLKSGVSRPRAVAPAPPTGASPAPETALTDNVINPMIC